MSWWCSATGQAWEWSFRAYPGIWLCMLLLGFAYWRGWRAARTRGELAPADRRRAVAFTIGLSALWLATDWPIGALGAGYLASVHMVQYQLYSLIAAPLLVWGIPEPIFARIVTRLRIDAAMAVLTRPFVAAVVFNAVLVATHSPIAIDDLRTSQLGSFVLDALWLAAAIVLWVPVLGPRHHRIASPGAQCLYLFFALGVVPMIPGAFLTFAERPLYKVYELAPRVGTISPEQDQQVAGLLMKVGNLPVLWLTIAVIFFRWAANERRSERQAAGAGVP
ncbi:MAG: cytochrome c oxidase assembly protein [Acidimicrobiales bacterium]|nr:cytochrome c oxidase assembly protein [Acidimicrobiales bacterium]